MTSHTLLFEDMLAVVNALKLIVLGLALHTLHEIVVIPLLGRSPTRLGNGRQTGEHKILHNAWLLDPLGPEIGLHTHILRLQFLGHIVHWFV